MDKLPLTSGRITARVRATARFNKLQPRKTEPFRIFKVQSHTFVIDNNCFANTVSIYHTTAAPGSESNEDVPDSEPARQSDSLETMSDSPRWPKDQTSQDVVRKAKPQIDYAVEQIADHRGCDRRRRYIAYWYRYRPKDITLEPAKIILPHSITMHNEQVNPE